MREDQYGHLDPLNIKICTLFQIPQAEPIWCNNSGVVRTEYSSIREGTSDNCKNLAISSPFIPYLQVGDAPYSLIGTEYLSCVSAIGKNVQFIFPQNWEEIFITSLLHRVAKPILTKGMKILSLKEKEWILIPNTRKFMNFLSHVFNLIYYLLLIDFHLQYFPSFLLLRFSNLILLFLLKLLIIFSVQNEG